MSLRIAFVTGAAQGIGEAIALRLADDKENISLFLLDLPEKVPHLESVVQKIEARGKKAIYHTADVSVEEQIKTAVEKCVEVLGGLDIVSRVS